MVAETLSLAGKTALVTGSGHENGIGAGIAAAFARNGADVAIHYNTPGTRERAVALAEQIAKDSGVKTTVITGNVAEHPASKDIVAQALKGLGASKIDILVNAAADTTAQPLIEETPEHIAHSFGVNTFGPLYMTQAVVQVGKMSRGGRIINISSISSKMSSAPVAVYGAAKAATDSLTGAWAQELGTKFGITVNTIAPGPVITDSSMPYMVSPDGKPTEMQDMMVNMTRAEARLGNVEDIADAALLLAQEKSRWITGQYISVSGGITGWF